MKKKNILKVSFDQRLKDHKKRNPQLLKEIKERVDELHLGLGELTDIQAERVIAKLRKAVGSLI